MLKVLRKLVSYTRLSRLRRDSFSLYRTLMRNQKPKAVKVIRKDGSTVYYSINPEGSISKIKDLGCEWS